MGCKNRSKFYYDTKCSMIGFVMLISTTQAAELWKLWFHNHGFDIGGWQSDGAGTYCREILDKVFLRAAENLPDLDMEKMKRTRSVEELSKPLKALEDLRTTFKRTLDELDRSSIPESES